ncbi:hypothetical protein KQX54_006254 [Cotesia glomerata]|uniref:Uncharacterized protein n=1 Tax=Cotesia glomerata TaxID=32391 RepID=A0AAV7IQ84_COTGL|nr:hypothetical protein KQX54_006254 [Cotesia glomerata]
MSIPMGDKVVKSTCAKLISSSVSLVASNTGARGDQLTPLGHDPTLFPPAPGSRLSGPPPFSLLQLLLYPHRPRLLLHHPLTSANPGSVTLHAQPSAAQSIPSTIPTSGDFCEHIREENKKNIK